MTTFILICVVILVAMVLLTRRQAKARKQKTRSSSDYKPQLSFMSKAEVSFFGVLRQAVADRAYIAAKVRVADVIQPGVSRAKDASKWHRAFNRIQSKHFDFVLCSVDGGQCRAAIELDDKSHREKNRRERDVVLDEAMQSAGVPLVRVPAKKGYSIGELREILAPFLADSQRESREAAADKLAPEPQRPSCPTCGAAKVRCEGDSGSLAGKHFWKCSRYPACRYVEPITSE